MNKFLDMALLGATLWLSLLSSNTYAISPYSTALLKKVVNVNSGTQNIEGLAEVRTIFAKEFESLGYTVKLHKASGGRAVLEAKFENSQPSILYMGHIDTVFPKEHSFQSFSKEKNKMKGPGIIDMKGGIVMMLDILRKASPDVRKQVMVILNDDEEIGSPKSKAVYLPLVNNIKYALVFEPGTAEGDVVTSQSGVKWISVNVKGKAAHAGSAHAEGANACVELSRQAVEISKLTDYERQLTVNVGVLTGGTKPNVVCEEAGMKIDIRYVRVKDLDKLLKDISAILNSPSSSLTKAQRKAIVSQWSPVVGMPSFEPNSSSDIFNLAQRTAKKVGQEINGVHVGYGSDGNHLSGLPIQILVGVGPYGDNIHSKDEYMLIDSYQERLDFNSALLEDLVKEIKN